MFEGCANICAVKFKHLKSSRMNKPKITKAKWTHD